MSRKPLVQQRNTPEFWADWLIDAVGGATQNRALLRGDEAEDKVLTESIYLNGLKALQNLLASQSSADSVQPVAWRWRSIFNDSSWCYGPVMPTAHDQYVTEPLYVRAEPQIASGAEYDQIALEAARKIEALSWNDPVQRKARIQCVVIEALRRSHSQEGGGEYVKLANEHLARCMDENQVLLARIEELTCSRSQAVSEVDPADLWDRYCKETPKSGRTPQGAMAFAVDALTRPVCEGK